MGFYTDVLSEVVEVEWKGWTFRMRRPDAGQQLPFLTMAALVERHGLVRWDNADNGDGDPPPTLEPRHVDRLLELLGGNLLGVDDEEAPADDEENIRILRLRLGIQDLIRLFAVWLQRCQLAQATKKKDRGGDRTIDREGRGREAAL